MPTFFLLMCEPTYLNRLNSDTLKNGVTEIEGHMGVRHVHNRTGMTYRVGHFKQHGCTCQDEKHATRIYTLIGC